MAKKTYPTQRAGAKTQPCQPLGPWTPPAPVRFEKGCPCQKSEPSCPSVTLDFHLQRPTSTGWGLGCMAPSEVGQWARPCQVATPSSSRPDLAPSTPGMWGRVWRDPRVRQEDLGKPCLVGRGECTETSVQGSLSSCPEPDVDPAGPCWGSQGRPKSRLSMSLSTPGGTLTVRPGPTTYLQGLVYTR